MGIFGSGFGGYGYGSGGRRGGIFHLTWIIALLMAGFALVRFLTQTEVNPVTGEQQHVAMTPAQEVSLGLQAAPQMARQNGGEISPADPRTQLVRRIGQQLVGDIDARTMPWQFQFHLLDNDQMINAFALPGGQVFITTGLLNRLQNTAQLAGVLGHEMGHVIHRHAAQHMAKGQLGQSLATAVLVGTSSGNDRERMAGYAAVLANQMLQLKYSRDDESQADAYGVQLMPKAGYDPRQMIEVMRILKESSGGRGGPEFLATHPDPGNRAGRIGAQIKQMFPNGVPSNLSSGEPLTQALRSPTGASGRPRANDRW